MRRIKEERLLRMYVRSIITEDFGGGGAMESPYGAHFVNDSDIFKHIISPFFKPFKVAVAKSKEIVASTKALLAVIFEAVATTVNPLLASDYKKIFEKEKEEIEKIKKDNADIYKSIWDGFRSTDVAALGFFCYPGTVLATNVALNAPGATLNLLEKLAKGAEGVSDFISDVISDDTPVFKKEYDPYLWGKKDISQYSSEKTKSESFIRERKLSRKERKAKKKEKSSKSDVLKEILSSEKFINAVINTPYARQMQVKAREIYKDTLKTVYERAKSVTSVNSLEELKKIVDIDEIPEIKRLEEIKQDEERKKAEAMILSVVKKSMKAVYTKNLEQQIKDATKAGIPSESPFVKNYYDVINKIKSL